MDTSRLSLLPMMTVTHAQAVGISCTKYWLVIMLVFVGVGVSWCVYTGKLEKYLLVDRVES